MVELVGADGSIIDAKVGSPNFSNAPTARPYLPKTLPNYGTDKPAPPYDVSGTEGVQYRMTDCPEGRFGGQFVVLAIPLTDVQSTLSALLQTEALISLAVVAATVVLALVIIEIGLRPLRRMGAVAKDIAAGDLTRRVEPATPRTEIGRLGLALNAMLSQIEAAFAQRTASGA